MGRFNHLPFSTSNIRGFMLYLVEGLNCSGKTDWIDATMGGLGKISKVLDTGFCNPLRWNLNKKSVVHSVSNGGIFASVCSVGAYEAIFNVLNFVKENYFWDRTYVSAWAYGTIDWYQFQYLTSMLKDIKHDIRFIYMNTPISICLERLFKLRATNPKYKDYAIQVDRNGMEEIKMKFDEAFKFIKSEGFVVQEVRL